MGSSRFACSAAERWVEVAKWAPSGGNIQPWKVSVGRADGLLCVKLFLDHAKVEKSPLDVGGAASWMALGAFSLNLEVAAQHDNYELAWTEFGGGEEVVSLYFKRAFQLQPLFPVEVLLSRKTHRVPFLKRPIRIATKSHIDGILGRHFNHLMWKDLTFSRNKVIEALRQLEYFRWCRTDYLNSFLEEITVSEEDMGIPINQLGVNVFTQLFLKLLKKFPALGKSFRLGAYNFAVLEGLVGPIKNSGAIYFLQAKSQSNESLFYLGRAFQEVWCYSAQQGYGFQPIGTPLVSLGRTRLGTQDFSEQSRLWKSYELFREMGLDFELPVLGFRMGYEKVKMVGKTKRKDPKINYENLEQKRQINLA